MGKRIICTCDYLLGTERLVCGLAATFRVNTEIINGNTVFTVAERYSCDNPLHLGNLVAQIKPMHELVNEATSSGSGKGGKYPVNDWIIRNVKVSVVKDSDPES